MSVASITSSAPTPTPSPGAGTSAVVAALRESLLQRSSSVGTMPTPRREAIRQLRERADVLRRELDAVVVETEAADAATRDAERRERDAAAELYAAARTGETQCAKLRELEQELRDKDGRIKVLAAIVDTILTKRK
jgi:hypothetical protein